MKLLLLTALFLQAPTDPASEYLRRAARPALDALLEAAPRRHTLVLGDVHPAAEPKRFLVELVRQLHARDLIDALALEVPLTQQPAIETYLDSEPEALEDLRDRPLLLRAHWGASREYLEIYRTVRALNRETRDRSIEVLAIDAPRGPPMVASRREALNRYVHRDAVMELRARRWREEHPDGRLLIFVGVLHSLKGVEANLEYGGEITRLIPLATRLERLWPGQVYTALSDAAPPGHPDGASRIYALAKPVLDDRQGPVAVAPGPPLDGIGAPVYVSENEIRIELLPRSYRLGTVTDLYLYFGPSPGLTPVSPARP